jgi:hypothetical protein
MTKFFNTAGPIREEDHYFIPIAHRIDLDEVLMLIGQKKYFVLHAPRQSGKTTTLLELCKILNNSGRYKCLYINVESAQTARENVAEAMTVIVNRMMALEKIHLKGDQILAKNGEEALRRSPTSALLSLLQIWATESSLPTVLIIDEIDSLIGDSLVSVLRQLRTGYNDRPKHYPQSIIHCGVRDIRDYRIHTSSEKDPVTGGSCFNVNSKSLSVGSFKAEEVADLYRQHTEATGQVFSDDAIQLAFDLTQGQPWLVNALAYETCFENPHGRDRSHNITAEMIVAAKDALILRRVTHLDQLADKLKEPRVRSVIEPMLRGELPPVILQADMEYVTDLGLVTKTPSGLKVANPIYHEVIPRQLTYINQTLLDSVITRQWYINHDGSIAVEKLLQDFQQFFRENSEAWIQRFDQYHEAGPQLLLQAYLQRVVNGGGRIDREYGLGRGRTDILLTWPYGPEVTTTSGTTRGSLVQKAVFELKIVYGSKEKTLAKGLEQTKLYLDQVGLKAGHLLIFNRDINQPWDAKIYREEHSYQGCSITVWGM